MVQPSCHAVTFSSQIPRTAQRQSQRFHLSLAESLLSPTCHTETVLGVPPLTKGPNTQGPSLIPPVVPSPALTKGQSDQSNLSDRDNLASPTCPIGSTRQGQSHSSPRLMMFGHYFQLRSRVSYRFITFILYFGTGVQGFLLVYYNQNAISA